MTLLPHPATVHDARRKPARRCRALRAMTFLAPNLLPLYEFIVDRLADRLGVAVDLEVGTAYRQLDAVDLAFVCGLPYVEAVARGCPLEPVAPPVLPGERYAGKPIYFSDV